LLRRIDGALYPASLLADDESNRSAAIVICTKLGALFR
jgi:hypothetical protein